MPVTHMPYLIKTDSLPKGLATGMFLSRYNIVKMNRVVWNVSNTILKTRRSSLQICNVMTCRATSPSKREGPATRLSVTCKVCLGETRGTHVTTHTSSHCLRGQPWKASKRLSPSRFSTVRPGYYIEQRHFDRTARIL